MILNSIKRQKTIVDYLTLFYILFLCYVASNKLLNISSFQTNLLKTGLFPTQYIGFLSFMVTFIEFIVVIFLIFRIKMGLILFTSMILVFTVYISFLNYNGQYEICGCGGILNGLKYQYHLFINIVLLASSLFCLFLIKHRADEKEA
jgi:hypothetical protein